MQARRRLLIVFGLFATLLLSGCSLSDGSALLAPTPPSAPVQSIDLAEAPERHVNLLWPKDGGATGVHGTGADLSPDGSRVLLLDRTVSRFAVYDRTGKLLRQYRFPAETSRLGLVRFVGGDLVGAISYGSDAAGRERGTFRLFSMQGADGPLWTQPLQGAGEFVASADGGRIALFDDGADQLSLFTRQGEKLAEFAVVGEAGASFSRDGRILLVHDADQVFVADAGGKVLKKYGIGGSDLPELRLALSEDGDRIAVATSGGDNTLYLFDVTGDLLWRYFLPADGSVRVAFAPDDRSLAVFPMGGAGGVGLFRVDGGKELWRSKFSGKAGRLKVVDAFFSPSGGAFLTVVAGEDGTRRILGLDPTTGVPLWKAVLAGREGSLQLSEDGKTLLVFNPPGAGDAVGSTVTLYALDD